MFLIDVVGIIVYYYTLGKVDPKSHLRLALILALGGTGTLSLIVGILGFKLSPGDWLHNGEILSGFYNPTFWPQYLMRFLLMQTITGAWGVLMASWLPRDFPERQKVIRWAGTIGLVGMAGALLVGRYWYWANVPARSKALLSTNAFPAVTVDLLIGGGILTAAFLLLASWKPQLQSKLGAMALFIVMFSTVFGAERTREILRKPDVVNGYMSSNQLTFTGLPARGIESEEAKLNRDGSRIAAIPARGRRHRLGAVAGVRRSPCRGRPADRDLRMLGLSQRERSDGDPSRRQPARPAPAVGVAAQDLGERRGVDPSDPRQPRRLPVHARIRRDRRGEGRVGAYLVATVEEQQGPPTTLPAPEVTPVGGGHGG